MNRLRLLVFLAAAPLLAQDVYVPPVPIGIAREGKTRTPKRPIPFPSADERWVRVRTPHFDILSSASEERTRAIANDLETLAGALLESSQRFEVSPTPPTIFVFGRRRESQPYFDLLIGSEGTKVTGVYVRHDGGGTMFVDAGRGAFERTAMHELVHDLLRQTEVVPPLWVEEGLAEYFSNAELKKDAVIAGAPIREHIALLRRSTIDVPAMFAVRAESAEATAPLFYAQSWAAVDWLMRLDPARFYPFLRDLESGATPAAALQTHYAKTIEDLEQALRKPKGGKQQNVGRASARQEPTLQDLPRATLLFELGAFLSHVSGAGEESLRHYREALNVDPRHARALAALGEFERAIAADPANAEVHLTYAETLLGRAIGDFAGMFEPAPDDTERFRKARALAEKAIALGGDEGLARGLIGTSYLVESDFAPAIAQLERVRELAPSRMDFALHLYAMYLRSGDRAKASALFVAAFERARDKQTVFAARNLYLQIETDRANALSKAGKLDEAAVVVREIAAVTTDAMARRELEQQAAQLAATATINRHIQAYNQAIAALTAGRKREAAKILDDLLRVATDAQVIRDAQRLRNDLRMQ